MSYKRRTHSQELVLPALVEIERHYLKQSWVPQHSFALAYRKEALTIVISVHIQEYSILEWTQRSIQRVEQAGKSLPQRSTNQLVVCMPVSFDQGVESIGLACQLTT
jgi:hypothetical protein